jgi:hypothetical protein
VAQSVFRKVLNNDPEHPGTEGQLELLVADLDPERNAGALRPLGELRGHGPQHRGGLSGAERDHLTAGLELAQEEHVVDQLIHQRDLVPHLIQHRGGIAARQPGAVDQGEQAGERRSELV